MTSKPPPIGPTVISQSLNDTENLTEHTADTEAPQPLLGGGEAARSTPPPPAPKLNAKILVVVTVRISDQMLHDMKELWPNAYRAELIMQAYRRHKTRFFDFKIPNPGRAKPGVPLQRWQVRLSTSRLRSIDNLAATLEWSRPLLIRALLIEEIAYERAQRALPGSVKSSTRKWPSPEAAKNMPKSS